MAKIIPNGGKWQKTLVQSNYAALKQREERASPRPQVLRSGVGDHLTRQWEDALLLLYASELLLREYESKQKKRDKNSAHFQSQRVESSFVDAARDSIVCLAERLPEQNVTKRAGYLSVFILADDLACFDATHFSINYSVFIGVRRFLSAKYVRTFFRIRRIRTARYPLSYINDATNCLWLSLARTFNDRFRKPSYSGRRSSEINASAGCSAEIKWQWAAAAIYYREQLRACPARQEQQS